MGTKRFLTTTQASEWLQRHYDVYVPPHTVRRLAKADVIKAHRARRNSWYTFTREALAAYAREQGFTEVGYDT